MAKTNLCILTPYVFQSVHNTISYLSSCFWMCFGVFGQFVIVSKCFRTFLQKPMTYALLPMDLWSKISQDGYGWHAGPCTAFLARRSGRQHWSNWVFARDRNYWEIWGPLSCREYDMIVTREIPRQRTLPTKCQTKFLKKNLGRLPTESLKRLNSEQHLTAHGPGDHSVYYMVNMATTACHANGQGRKNPWHQTVRTNLHTTYANKEFQDPN